MKTILLLGGYGFIGTNILKYIDLNNNNEYNVVVFDRFPSHHDNLRFNCVVQSYAGDFSDEYLIEKVFEENTISLVIHSLSASVPSTSLDNEFDIRFNVLPTIKLLNQMVKHGVNSIVFISSGGAIYGDHYVDGAGHFEEEVLFPKSAYCVSKLIIEKYLYLYYVQYGIESLVLRLSNPYGPFHYSQKQGIINIALERAIENLLFEVWGDGDGLKDYIFIEDFCAILFALINQREKPYDVINVGSGSLHSVNDILGEIKKVVNPSFGWKYNNANQLDVQDFRLNLSKLKSIIGDFSYTDLNSGIQKTFEWYCQRNCHSLEVESV